MMTNYTKQIGSFVACDAQGRKYVITVNQTMVRHHDGTEVGYRKSMRTQDGRVVNFISGGRYEILGNVEILVTSSDAEAPKESRGF